MRIKRIKLLTTDIESATRFYAKTLELPIISTSDSSVTFQVGSSQLSFHTTVSNIEPYYHFAFNITPNRVHEAVKWLNHKGIKINQVNNNDVVHSNTWNSDSIYFYDSIGNIVEFIARHSLSDMKKDDTIHFDLLSISEIGLATEDVMTLSSMIQDQYKEPIYLNSDKLFAPIGDEEGLFILSSVERIWLGSNKKVEIFPLEAVIAGLRNDTCQLSGHPYTIKSEC